MIAEVPQSNRQVYCHGHAVRRSTTFGGREPSRTITDDQFLLSDISIGEAVMSFRPPMVAPRVRGRHVGPHSIQGMQMSKSTHQ